MSIFPQGGVGQVWRKHVVAAMDLAIPDLLIESGDAAEWKFYSQSLPVPRAIEKFGEAIDSSLALLPGSVDAAKRLTRGEKLKAYSKVEAATIMAGVLISKIETPSNGAQAQFATDVDLAVFYVVELLRGLRSPLAEQWEQRQALVRDRFCHGSHGPTPFTVLYDEGERYVRAVEMKAQARALAPKAS